MRGLVFQIARPITVWSLHFIAIYALISAVCAPRGLMDVDTMRLVAAIVTGVSAVFVVTWLTRAVRAARQLDKAAPDRPLHVAVIWTALISLLALFANLWPVATMATCAG